MLLVTHTFVQAIKLMHVGGIAKVKTMWWWCRGDIYPLIYPLRQSFPLNFNRLTYRAARPHIRVQMYKPYLC